MQFFHYPKLPGPISKILVVELPLKPIDYRDSIFEIPGPTYFELLQDKIFRGHHLIIAGVHALFALSPEDLLVMGVACTQDVNGNSFIL
jgi:hypothetical protein